MYIKSDEMVIALEPGEDVRTVLRVFADEIFKASPKFNEYATDFDPSLVMTEEFADSFIHEYNGMLRLNMDNGHGRSYKVGIKQTAQGNTWSVTLTILHTNCSVGCKADYINRKPSFLSNSHSPCRYQAV